MPKIKRSPAVPPPSSSSSSIRYEDRPRNHRWVRTTDIDPDANDGYKTLNEKESLEYMMNRGWFGDNDVDDGADGADGPGTMNMEDARLPNLNQLSAKYRVGLDDLNDDEEDDDDEEEDYDLDIDLPEIVQEEYDQREELLEQYNGDKSRLPPMKPNVIQAFRNYYNSGKFSPVGNGGAAHILEHLGAEVLSTDPMVKSFDANEKIEPTWRMNYPVPSKKEMEENLVRHRGEVRLLRYKEFVQEMTTGEDALDLSGCFFQPDPDEGEDMGDYGPDMEIDRDWHELKDDEVVLLGKAFTLGMYGYCNSDKNLLGMGTGVEIQPVENTTEAERAWAQEHDGQHMYVHMSVKTMIDQCKELETRYTQQKRPLGGLGNNTVGKSVKKKGGKKNRKKKPTKKKVDVSHAGMIHDHVVTLFKDLVELIQRPSLDFAFFIVSLAEMFSAAVIADPDINRAICREAGVHILKLRNKCLGYARDVDSGAISQSKYVADIWWSCYGNLGNMIGITMAELADEQTRSGKDVRLATDFFETKVLFEVKKNISSESTAEVYGGYNILTKSMRSLSNIIALNLIRSNNVWQTIQSTCTLEMKTFLKREFKSLREQARGQHYLPLAACDALELVFEFCCDGFGIDDGNVAKLEAEPMAYSLVQNGVVQLFMSCAKSKFKSIKMPAMQGLGQISRLKEARQILFKRKDTIGVVRAMLSSNNGDIASSTMLLIVHLLWDKEWRDPIMSIQPPIEGVCLKWATYGMKCFCDKVDENKVSWERVSKISKSNMVKCFQIRMKVKKGVALSGEEEKELLEHEERDSQMKNGMWHCGDFDKKDCASDGSIEYSISRPLLLLSTMFFGIASYRRVQKNHFYQLAANCLDSPNIDIYGSAIALLSNLLASRAYGFGELEPKAFADPDHVLDAVSYQIQYQMREGIWRRTNHHTMYGNVLSELSGSLKWAPYFKNIPRDSNIWKALRQFNEEHHR